jgi:hypothetical protein
MVLGDLGGGLANQTAKPADYTNPCDLPSNLTATIASLQKLSALAKSSLS